MLVVALLILGSSNGHSLFGLGVTSPLAYPAFALVPAAVALLALGARGSLLRRGALLFAGYAVAFTVTMWVAVEPDAESLGTVLAGLSFVLAVAAGVGFAVFGIRRIVRPQAQPKAGRAWLGVALAGVGFAFAELPDADVGLWVPREVLSQAFLYNSVFAGIGLYLAFLAGVATAIATGLAAAALVKPPARSSAGNTAGSTAGNTAEPAAKRRAPAVGGTLAGLGGLFVAYVGLVGLIFLADESIVYENNLGALEGRSMYGFFAPAIAWPYLPLIILAVLAGLVVAGLLRSRRSASAVSPDRPTI